MIGVKFMNILMKERNKICCKFTVIVAISFEDLLYIVLRALLLKFSAKPGCSTS